MLTGGAGAVDEDAFIAAFEDVPKIHVSRVIEYTEAYSHTVLVYEYNNKPRSSGTQLVQYSTRQVLTAVPLNDIVNSCYAK